MRIPLSRLEKDEKGIKVYSLVAELYSQVIDIDLNRLVRSEWNPLTDRFRVWYIPKIEGYDDKSLCHLFIRRMDEEDDVLSLMQIIFNLESTLGEQVDQPFFTVAILSNDDVRARTMLSTILNNPPSFCPRTQLKLIEHKWTSKSRALETFRTSILAKSWGKGGKIWRASVKGKSALKLMAKMKPYMGFRWWKSERSRGARLLNRTDKRGEEIG